MSKKYKYFDIKTDGDYYSRGDILQFTDDPVPTFVVRNYNRKWRKIANKFISWTGYQFKTEGYRVKIPRHHAKEK